MLRAKSTMEAFYNRIIRNADIMQILKLPVINETDSEDLILEKRKVLIEKFIKKTAELPDELGTEYPTKIIDDIEYSDYGKIRMTMAFASSIKTNHDLFGNPQIEINIYYDNTENDDDIYTLLDLVSNEFSGQDLEIITDEGKAFIRNIRCEGQTAQTSIINNYERIGLRFSFFATIYKN